MISHTFRNWRLKWGVGVAVALLPVGLALAAPAKAPKLPSAGKEEPVQRGAENLRGILVVPAKEGATSSDELLGYVKPEGVTGIRGVVVQGPAFLQRRDFKKLLAPNLGHTLTDTSLRQMQTNIIKFCRQRGHSVIDVIFRDQEITDGTIQIAVIEGKIDKMGITNMTRAWFKNSIITNAVRLRPGGVVVEQRLNEDLNWVNRNTYQDLGYFNGSFRDVSASFKQGDLGKTEMELQAVEKFPLRGFAGVDDAGIQVIGVDRFFAGFNWANAFGLDQRLTYQYISDLDFDELSEHIASYAIPLPWRHELTVFGMYADLNPDYSQINPSANYTTKGTFDQVSARYAIPLPAPLHYDHEITAGFDFKRTDTPLLFTGSPLIAANNNIAVAQFMLGYSGRLRDPWGSTAVSLQGFYSPGGIGQYNTDAAFSEFQPGATPQYLYGRAELRRTTDLPGGFSWYTRAAGQLSDARLVATEAFMLGGWDTVRGYDQNIVGGDNGWLLVNELHSMPLPLFGNLPGKGDYDRYDPWGSLRGGKVHRMDWIQGLVFLDYGASYYRYPPPPGWPSREILLSAGVGFRYQLMENLMVRFDYGWQLDRSYLNSLGVASQGPQPASRAHFSVEMSF